MHRDKQYGYASMRDSDYAGYGDSVIFYIQDATKINGSPGMLPFLGSLRERGIELRIAVCLDDIFKHLENNPESVVALSAQEKNIIHIVETIHDLRLRFPSVWVIVGGPMVEYYIEELLDAGVDIVITGEADTLFPLVLKALPVSPPSQHEFSSAFIEDLADAVNGKARIYGGGYATPRVFLKSPEKKVYVIEGRFLPTESELRDLWLYPWDLYRSGEWTTLNLHTQRGCPWNRCTFCTSPNVPLRRVLPRQLVDVVGQALNEPVEVIAFSDDTFIQDKSWTISVLEELQKMNLRGRLDLFAQVRVTREVEELIPLFANAGFSKLEIGVESLMPERAQYLEKCVNGEEYCALSRELVIKVAQAGIIPQINIILSDPASTAESIADEIMHMCQLVDKTHALTGIAPTFNFNLTLHPSRGSKISGRYPFRIKETKGISVPDEFLLSDFTSLFLMDIVKKEQQKSRFAASFEYIELFIESLEGYVQSQKDDNSSIAGKLSKSRYYCDRVRRRFESQFRKFIIQRVDTPDMVDYRVVEDCQLPHENVSIKNWLAGYHAGVECFSDMVKEMTTAENDGERQG